MADSQPGMLREFLIGIGFKIDDKQAKQFELFWEKGTKAFKEFGVSAAAAAVELGVAVVEIADRFEKLYYTSQRTGASVASLQALQFGAEQVGVSADAAAGAVEGIARAIAMSPGLQSILPNPGEKRGVYQLLDIVEKARKMSQSGPAGKAMAIQYGAQFGIDYQTLMNLINNYPQLLQAMIKQEALQKRLGVNSDDAAKKAVAFKNAIRDLDSRFQALETVLMVGLIPAGMQLIKWADEALDYLIKLDKQTGGWSTKILAVVSAIGLLRTALKALSIAKGVLSLGKLGAGAGAAAAGAGEGAVAAEAGGGLLAGLVSIPVLIGVAITAALAWIALHPDAFIRGAKEAGHMVAQGWRAAKGALTDDKIQASSVKLSNWTNKQIANWKSTNPEALATMAKLKGTLGGFVVKYEGFVKNFGTYLDQAGNPTVGFGHKIVKGEDFSKGLTGDEAITLLNKDLTKALNVVNTSVKVRMSPNQQKALTDFEFNVGEKAFNNSTLLKKLNSGDYAGAGNEFDKWDKIHRNGAVLVDPGLARRRADEKGAFNERVVNLTQNNETHIHDVGNPVAAGREAARQQGKQNNDMVRNMRGGAK